MSKFGVRGLIACLGLSVVTAVASGQRATPNTTAKAADPLLLGFENPGEAARPRVWWHWMNGNITWDGAQKDMDWMKRVGVAGLQAFDAGQATPQVVETRLPYMTDGWKEVFRNTAAYADKLGLELGVAGSPGWSETGGPWVTGPDAMKKYAWSVTRIEGGKHFKGVLPKPPTTTGVFQTSTAGGILGGRAPGQNPPEFYADQKVIAFRVPDTALPTPTITVSGGTLNAAALSDGDIEKAAIDLPAATDVGGISWIQFDYGRAVVVRGITFATSIAARLYSGIQVSGRNGAPPVLFRLESSDDGVAWRDTGGMIQTGTMVRTSSVDSINARYFRFVSVRQAPVPSGPLERFERPQQPPPETIPVQELALRGEATVHSFEEKGAFWNNDGYYALPSGTTGTSAAIKTADEVDLTEKMDAHGQLDWTPPTGNWMVLRLGYSLTGAMNRPASPEATGLEVDKLDAAAIKRYMNHYLAMYKDASGGLMGAKGLRAMMFDSWESANQNWTPQILSDFKRLRGYDATPWLPALAGYVVESPERSDAFLWDWRRTIQQLLKVNHYDQITQILHGIGITRYGEAHEAVFATMGDGMEMKQSADIPMGAMWDVTNPPGGIEPVYFNDLQESASVAHIYGQNLVASESLTGGPAFGSAPWDLKPTADAILLAGTNRIVIHTSTHQPVSKGPGTTLGVGQYFTRNETWAEQAKPWIDYLSRSSYMLQQGRGASDIAVFYGEAGPVVAYYRGSYPAVPDGYRYDYVNVDAILNKLQVKDGVIATETGMRYRAIFFGRGTERVTLPVLEKVRAMVQSGAVLIGPRPQGSPSLSDDPAKVKQVIDALWTGKPEATVGKGRVFTASDAGPALEKIGFAPDFSYEKPQSDSHVMFIHRRLVDGDAYFLSNRIDRAETIEASFRVSGLKPQLWDPASGLYREASYRIGGGRTQVTVPMDRFGSVFVVFRGKVSQLAYSVPAVKNMPIADLAAPWQVAFQPERGAPSSATFPQLSDFRDNADPGVRYFSGIATYPKDVDLTPQMIASGKLWLDLGKVDDLAEVWVNGKLTGTTWKPPYQVDISGAVQPGANHIEIKSVNLWVNRLIGDVQPGVTKKITFTAADGKITSNPDLPTRQQPRNRMPYRPDAPLRPSGLIGPISIFAVQQP